MANKTTHHVDLYDAASESVNRLGVALLLLRRLENDPDQHHGGYTQAVVQDVIEQCRKALGSGMKSDDQARATATAGAKKGGAR